MKLVFTTLHDGVLEFEVNKQSVTVGRGSQCDVILKVEGISRQHCRIETGAKGQFLITDLGSANGVLINNERIPANKPTSYPSYLPLSIGPIPQVTLEAEMHDIPFASSAHAPDQSTSSEIKLADRQKSKKFPRPRELGKPVKVSGENSQALIVAIILLAIGAIYYFLSGQTELFGSN